MTVRLPIVTVLSFILVYSGLYKPFYSSVMIITFTLFPYSGFTSSWYFASG